MEGDRWIIFHLVQSLVCPIYKDQLDCPKCFVLWSSEPSDESVGSQSQKSAGLIPLLLGIRWGSASIGMNRGNRMRHLALQLPFLWWRCGSGKCSPLLSLQQLGKRGLLEVGGLGDLQLLWKLSAFTQNVTAHKYRFLDTKEDSKS